MTLVLVHQAGATPAVWDAVRPHLQGIPVLAVPIDRVLDEMDRAGLARATIACVASDCCAGLSLALEQPGRVTGLGLVAPDLGACEVLDRLWEIRCRTQVLAGEQDDALRMRMIAERISAARYIEYAGPGRALLLERPEDVAGELAVLWAASLDGRVSRTRGSSSLRSAGRAADSPLPAD